MVTAKEIFSFVDGVADRFKPERVILFGSYAYGTPNADSDVDVLVVMPHRGPGHEQAARIRLTVGSPFPMDLLVRSSGQIVRRIAWNDFFLEEITRRGLVLYAADDPRVGAKGRRGLRRHLAASQVAQANPV